MATLYILLGLPGSGKSTYANKELATRGAQIICADDVRLAHGHRFYGPLESQIHGMLYTLTRAHMLRGLDVVIDDCITRSAYVQRWARLAEDMGYQVRIIQLSLPKATCIERKLAAYPDFPLEIMDMKDAELARNLPAIREMFSEAEWEVVSCR